MLIDRNNKKLLDTAITDCESLNTDTQWAVIGVNMFESIYLDYGPLHSNGMRERPLMTIVYSLSNTGSVIRTRFAHY